MKRVSRTFFFLSLGSLGWLASLPAATVQNSTAMNPGNYTELLTPAMAQANAGYGIASDANGAIFLDYVDNNEVINWTNATISSPSDAHHLVIRSRDGNETPRSPQGYQVQFYEAGSNYTNLLGTYLSERYRLTGYQQHTPGSISNFTNNPIQNFDLAPGTYDVRVTNLQGGKYPGYTGSHVAGIGWYQPNVVLNGTIGSAATVIQVEDATWRDNTGTTFQPQMNNSIGTWIDGEIQGNGNQWLDFEVSNPDGESVYQFNVRYRHDHSDPVRFNLFGIDPDGDLTEGPLASILLNPSGGWQGSNFIDSQWSGQFYLPEGLSSVRLNTVSPTGENGIIHLDSFSILAVPEPGRVFLGALFVLGTLVRRSRK